MRTIKIPLEWVLKAIDNNTPGCSVVGAVSVDWPELRLTEDQIVTNAVARAAGEREPYPDQSIFSIEIPRVVVAKV